MSAHVLLVAACALLGALVVVVAAWSVSAVAVRLDRLHHRVETSRASLDAALARRAAATEALAASGLLDPASSLALAGAAAEANAPLGEVERAGAEIDLARTLRAVLDADAVVRLHAVGGGSTLLADLGAACERVVLARAFEQEALAEAGRLRRRRLVRWGHLAGRSVLPAALPADDEPPRLDPVRQGGGMSQTPEDEWTLGADGLWFRRGARVLLVAGAPGAGAGEVRLLLVRGHDADASHRSWWFTVGGGIAEGEDPAAAAVRELAEEAGIVLDRDDLVGPVYSRSAVFDFFARTCRQDELLYLARLPEAPAVSTAGWTPLEGQTLDELRWWSLADLADAEADGVEVYPRGLAALVAQLLPGWDGVLRAIG